MDWKSLTTTACFPITTDYYPEKCVLEAEYEEAPYNLDGGSFIEDFKNEALVKDTLSNVLQELVSQRLIQVSSPSCDALEKKQAMSPTDPVEIQTIEVGIEVKNN